MRLFHGSRFLVIGLALAVPVLTGANGNGCGPGQVIIGNDTGGGSTTGAGGGATGCDPTQCGPAPAIAEQCPGGDTVVPVCEPDAQGTCGWVIPPCPPPGDAGACCPASWQVYSCTWPAGGSGLACHDPALGCASSTTCGQGCDKVVSGVCEADAGACCPASWQVYSCTWPNGDSGLACHDPALGCASSTTCGQGCDKVVSGVCGP